MIREDRRTQAMLKRRKRSRVEEYGNIPDMGVGQTVTEVWRL